MRMRCRANRRSMFRRGDRVRAGVTLAAGAFASLPAGALAAGLNTNAALTPPKEGAILRFQWRYTRLDEDPTGLGRDGAISAQPMTVVYGATERLALQTTASLVHADIDAPSGGVKETGFADIPALVKYRFFQIDKPHQTTRIAAIAGAEIPTFDDFFSSDSVDPIVGGVFTHQRLNWWIDVDALYQLNTAGGPAGDDQLRWDVALSRRLVGGESDAIGPWGLYGIAEVNASHLTDGTTEVFASPGVQFISPRVILEAGAQLPMAQDLESGRLGADFTLVLSLRMQF